MGFNFDEIIDRRNTNSIKYDFMSERGKAEDLIPHGSLIWILKFLMPLPKPWLKLWNMGSLVTPIAGLIILIPYIAGIKTGLITM